MQCKPLIKTKLFLCISWDWWFCNWGLLTDGQLCRCLLTSCSCLHFPVNHFYSWLGTAWTPLATPNTCKIGIWLVMTYLQRFDYVSILENSICCSNEKIITVQKRLPTNIFFLLVLCIDLIYTKITNAVIPWLLICTLMMRIRIISSTFNLLGLELCLCCHKLNVFQSSTHIYISLHTL